MGAAPRVTAIVPTLDEEAHIEATLATIAAQGYDGEIEVLVVDGGSTDRTRELAAARGARVLDNPARIQAAALNIGLRAATGDVAVRVDGHCELEPDYVARCVEALEATGAAMVGGSMRPRAAGPVAGGIAAAMSSRWGVGPARFHVGGEPGWVDTVYLGAYRVADALAVGGYDETFVVNEDAEFALRLAARGGIWFDPSIRSTYTPRSSFRSLARQFFRYGRGRARTVRHHPRSLRPRQVAAPALVVALALPGRRVVGATYLAAVGALAVGQARRGDADAAVGFAVSLPLMHLSWGAGFLVGLVAPEVAPVAPTSGAGARGAAT